MRTWLLTALFATLAASSGAENLTAETKKLLNDAKLNEAADQATALLLVIPDVNKHRAALAPYVGTRAFGEAA